MSVRHYIFTSLMFGEFVVLNERYDVAQETLHKNISMGSDSMYQTTRLICKGRGGVNLFWSSSLDSGSIKKELWSESKIQPKRIFTIISYTELSTSFLSSVIRIRIKASQSPC